MHQPLLHPAQDPPRPRVTVSPHPRVALSARPRVSVSSFARSPSLPIALSHSPQLLFLHLRFRQDRPHLKDRNNRQEPYE